MPSLPDPYGSRVCDVSFAFPGLPPCLSLLFFFNLTYSRWTSSLPSCLWSLRIFPSLPGSHPSDFLLRCKFSTLTTRQPMVEFSLFNVMNTTFQSLRRKNLFNNIDRSNHRASSPRRRGSRGLAATLHRSSCWSQSHGSTVSIIVKPRINSLALVPWRLRVNIGVKAH